MNKSVHCSWLLSGDEGTSAQQETKQLSQREQDTCRRQQGYLSEKGTVYKQDNLGLLIQLQGRV